MENNGLNKTALLNEKRIIRRDWHKKKHYGARLAQKRGVSAKRCPSWVYKWAEKRRKTPDFWRLKGYF